MSNYTEIRTILENIGNEKYSEPHLLEKGRTASDASTLDVCSTAASELGAKQFRAAFASNPNLKKEHVDKLLMHAHDNSGSSFEDFYENLKQNPVYKQHYPNGHVVGIIAK